MNQPLTYRTASDPAAPSAARSEGAGPLDAAFAPVLGEFGALKRLPAGAGMHRSLADEGFRRAWADLLAGASLEDVALTEMTLAAAQIALRPVDAAQLADAGVSLDDRLTVYRNAAARTLGRVSDRRVARVEQIASGAERAGSVPHFVEVLSTQARAGALSEGSARLVIPPEEMQSEHAWCVATMASLLEVSRGADPADAFLLGLSHHLADAYRETPVPHADAPIPAHRPDAALAERPHGDAVAPSTARALARALDQCPPELAARIAELLAAREDLSRHATEAFLAADLADRVLQQRHYANLAGFSLSDAMDAREFVSTGPTRDFELDVLVRFRLTF